MIEQHEKVLDLKNEELTLVIGFERMIDDLKYINESEKGD
jgi:hypothetical protein